MYPHQLERLTAALARHSFEALVATTPANLAYLTSVSTTAPPATPGAPTLAVMSPAGAALVLPAAAMDALAEARAAVDHVVTYRGEAPAAALASALDLLDVHDGTVGLDTGGLSSASARAIAAALGSRAVMEGSGALLEARQVKAPWEIDALERALIAAEEALNAVVQMLAPGVSEREAAQVFETEVRRRGAIPRAPVIAFGTGGKRGLRDGDLVRLDVGCVREGYHAAVARTAVMGSPASDQESITEALLQGVDAALAAAQPGARASAVAGTAMKAVRAAGLADFAPPDVGRGIGLELREPPVLEAAAESALEADMVLTIDLPHVAPDGARAHVRETVLVGRQGPRVLNRTHRGLLVLD